MERPWNYYFEPKGITSDEDKGNLQEVRIRFIDMSEALEAKLPDGRYKSLVKTKLEEAAMFATKAFSHK